MTTETVQLSCEAFQTCGHCGAEGKLEPHGTMQKCSVCNSLQKRGEADPSPAQIQARALAIKELHAKGYSVNGKRLRMGYREAVIPGMSPARALTNRTAPSWHTT